MELYTLISLIIGIFGGTYAALNALRSNFESEIKEADKKCDEKVNAIKLIRRDNESMIRNCENHRDKIHKAHNIWCWANLLPALFFCVLIFVIAIWVVWDWDDVTMQHTAAELAVLKNQSPWCFF